MRVTYVEDEGWIGLYVDGRLRLQGDSLDYNCVDEVLKALGISFSTYDPVPDESGDGFPETFDELLTREVVS